MGENCLHRLVEEITRDAFWNLYVPGACEHYIVHTLRSSPDCIKPLTFVALADNELVGHIIYSKSAIVDAAGKRFETITFGPVSVTPALHNQGIGSKLIRHSLKEAADLGYSAVIIFGYPNYYKKFGFRSGKDFGVSAPDGRFLAAMQVLPLRPGALTGVSGKYVGSPVFEPDAQAVEIFDQTFLPKEKRVEPSQHDFALMVDKLA